MSEGLRVVKLTAENVKRIRCVEITPEGDLVLIKGPNAAGKTSVLDAIQWAICGKRSMPPNPIREGEERAEINLDVGDYAIKRVVTEKDDYLTVSNKDGAKFTSPQKILDALYGDLTFDPLEFVRMDRKAQRDLLMSLVGLGQSLDDLDAMRKAKFSERTEVRGLAKRLNAQLEPYEDVPEKRPEAVDVRALNERRQELEASRAASKEAQDGVARAEQKLLEAQERLADAQRDVDNAEAEVELAREMAKGVPEWTAESVAELESIDEGINGAAESQRALARFDEKVAKVTELEQQESKVQSLTKDIDEIDAQKVALVQAADMPVEGLGFDEDGVTYQGQPFVQASSAEQLRVGLAVAMALNPTLRVIRITDGSLLDSQNMAIIAEMAAEGGYQIWIEQVEEKRPKMGLDDDGNDVQLTDDAGNLLWEYPVGIMFEEGEVVSVDGEPVSTAAEAPDEGDATLPLEEG